MDFLPSDMALPSIQWGSSSSPHSSLLFAVLVPFVVFTAYTVYQLFLSPLSQVKGPFFAALSRLWLLKHSRDGDMHRTMISLHSRYGKLVRTGPDEVSVSDLATIKKIYGAGTKFRKSDWYSVWQGRRTFDLFAERDEGIHANQRRLVSGIYAMQNLMQHQDQVDKAIEALVRRMRDQGSGVVVDLGVWLQLFAFGRAGDNLLQRTRTPLC